MALMLPSLTQRRESPALKRRGHSHTEVPAGTWHMDITSQAVDRSQADGLTAARSQQQKAAAVQRQVAARKQRYLACAFSKLHVVAVRVQPCSRLLIRLTEVVVPVRRPLRLTAREAQRPQLRGES